MAINLKFDSECGLLRASITGKLKPEKYREVMQQITADDQYPDTVPTIWDLREFDFVSFDKHLVENISRIRKAFTSRRPAKIAYVISTPLGYGMMRMFQAMTD